MWSILIENLVILCVEQLQNEFYSSITGIEMCTRTLCLPPTTFLFLWLRNKTCFANVVGTQIARFSIRNEPQNISFERDAKDNTKWVGCNSIHIVY